MVLNVFVIIIFKIYLICVLKVSVYLCAFMLVYLPRTVNYFMYLCFVHASNTKAGFAVILKLLKSYLKILISSLNILNIFS